MTKKIQFAGTVLLTVLWAAIAAFAWFGQSREISDTERRTLAQFPELSKKTVLSGKFMEDFESYTADQFPGRDRFRQLKALVHYNLLGQKDNNGIYITQGHATKLEYPIKEQELDYALDRLEYVYQTYLADTQCNIYNAVVPDKGYYLAQQNGYPAMDYPRLFDTVRKAMPWATPIDLTTSLSDADYYFTDTHWRQERLIPAAQTLAQAMNVTAPKAEDYNKTPVDRPFYGVYYGQSALPLACETLYLMESELLDGCRVYDYETDSYSSVYNLDMQQSKDLYDVYLSGAKSLLRIENPNASTERELIVFRDSFGSSIVPLLVQDYRSVTLVDIRYLGSPLLGRYLEFTDQDVLFLYSTLVLNNGSTLK